MKLYSVFRPRNVAGISEGRKSWQRYGFALVCVALATLLDLAMPRFIGGRYPFSAYYVAVAFATSMGGAGPGFLALVLGYLAEDWYISVPHALEILNPTPAFVIETFAYILVGLSLILLICWIRNAEIRAQRAAREAQTHRERLEAVLQQMPEGVIIADAASGKLVLYNKQAEKISGQPFSACHDITEFHQYKAFHPDGRPYEIDEWPLARSLKKGETITDEEMEFLRPNGTRAILAVSSAPIRDAQGKIVSVVKSFRDISERKQAQAARNRLAAIVENSSDAFISLTLDGIISAWNHGAEKIFGYAADEVMGQSISLLLPPERVPENQSFLKKFRHGQMIYHHEMVRMRKDGKRIPIALTVSPILDSGGTTVGISIIATDISERKKAEEFLRAAQEKLKGHAEELEQQVVERTAKLEETIKSLEGVCYHIAHDLRAPVRSMQGFSSLLLENYSPSLDEAGKDFLRRLAVSATRMDNLIQDLLEYGKLSHVSLPATWVKLDAALETVLASLAEEIALKNATITVAKNLPRIWANSALLEQILTHIVSNALKYVAPGIDPKVRIWADEEEASCTILVQDNGIGIEPDQHERIFHIFQRLYNENYCPGTGMGLAIVQKGVQRLGGRVRVESTPGRGSCFSIALPKPLCQCERRVGEVARKDSANNLEMATQE